MEQLHGEIRRLQQQIGDLDRAHAASVAQARLAAQQVLNLLGGPVNGGMPGPAGAPTSMPGPAGMAMGSWVPVNSRRPGARPRHPRPPGIPALRHHRRRPWGTAARRSRAPPQGSMPGSAPPPQQPAGSPPPGAPSANMPPPAGWLPRQQPPRRDRRRTRRHRDPVSRRRTAEVGSRPQVVGGPPQSGRLRAADRSVCSGPLQRVSQRRVGQPASPAGSPATSDTASNSSPIVLACWLIAAATSASSVA